MHGASDPASARATANARLLTRIQALHRQTKARYGAVKLWRALQLAGERHAPGVPIKEEFQQLISEGVQTVGLETMEGIKSRIYEGIVQQDEKDRGNGHH
jgi:hypothetical protein